jgi:DNA polymerase III subunit epsilon
MKEGLRAWWRRLWPDRTARPEPSAGVSTERWVLVDVESSGLDARRDRLIAIAAFAVHFPSRPRIVSGGHAPPPAPEIVMADHFERVLRQTHEPSAPIDKHNILIHGLGVGTQRAGDEPADALAAWEVYVGESPLVAYHSDFDRTLIDRACREHLGRVVPNPWLDLEPLAAVLHQEAQRRPLDHWLKRYRIECLARHQAAADTLASAQLLLRLWPMLPERVQAGGFKAALDFASGAQFLPGRH